MYSCCLAPLILQLVPLVNLSSLISPIPSKPPPIYTIILIHVSKGKVQFPDDSFIFALTCNFQQILPCKDMLLLNVFIHRINYFLCLKSYCVMENFSPYFSRYNIIMKVLTEFLRCNGLCRSIYSLIFLMYRISK